MFGTRADVDRHVQNCMKKINNEAEVIRENVKRFFKPAYCS